MTTVTALNIGMLFGQSFSMILIYGSWKEKVPLFLLFIECYNDIGLGPPTVVIPIARREQFHAVKLTIEKKAQLEYGNKTQITY